MQGPADVPGQCWRCQRSAASCRIRIGVGKFASQDSHLTGDTEHYEGSILELPVCRRCDRLYHLREDAGRWTPVILVIVPLGYATYGYAYHDAAFAAIVAIASFFLMLLFVGAFFWMIDSKIVRWIIGPERFVKAHPDYALLREHGYRNIFYVDRKGKAETKFSVALEDLK